MVIEVLLTILVAIVVIAVLYWALTMVLSALGSPPQFKQIAMVACVLVLLFMVLNIVFGVGGSPWRLHLG